MCENHACERKLEFGTSRPCLYTQVSPFPLPHLGPLPPPPRQETVPCKGYLWHSWALPPPFFVLYTAIYAPPFPRRERGGRPNISLKANGMGKGKEGWRERRRLGLERRGPPYSAFRYTTPSVRYISWIRRYSSFPARVATTLFITHGRRLFSRGGEEYLKICSTPQNVSRGGDTFSLCRGGVEGGKGGGQTKFLWEETGIFMKKD